MNRILITGADGFIGHHLASYFLHKEIEVFALVYPGQNVFEGEKNPHLHVIPLDLNEFNGEAMPGLNKVDTIYHLAWIGVSPESRENLDLQMKNIELAKKVLSMASLLGAKKVIFPGSTNEYLYWGKPINGLTPPSPSNAYGAVKVAIRYLAASYCEKAGIDFIYAIITGIYAADRKDSNVIFYTINSLLEGKKPSLTKLEQLWDYVYIDDVVRALYLIGGKGKGGAIYTIGHGDNWPLSHYVEIIHELIDPAAPLGIGEVPYKNTRMPSSQVDLSSLKADTGFLPETDFKTGILEVIKTIRQEKGF